MDWRTYIEHRPDVMLGKPVFRETRFTVEHILERLGNGAAIDDLLKSYPRLTREHVQAALAFAADSLSSERIISLDTTEAA